MKHRVIKEKCLGCGTCTALCPRSFRIAEDGKSEAVIPPGDSDEEILNAAKACPTEAIEVEEDNGKKVWPQ